MNQSDILTEGNAECEPFVARAITNCAMQNDNFNLFTTCDGLNTTIANYAAMKIYLLSHHLGGNVIT
jgi:hypothetical protein